MPTDPAIAPIQRTLLSLYFFHPVTYTLEDLSVFPILSRYFFSHGDSDWTKTYSKISSLCGSNRYQRVHALCNELCAETPFKSLRLDRVEPNQDDTVDLTQIPTHFTPTQLSFRSHFLKIFALTPETLLEFTLHILLFNPTLLQSDDTFSPLFTPSSLTSPIPYQSQQFNLEEFLSAFSDIQPTPPILAATLAGQLESIFALLALPTIDINSRIALHTKSLRSVINDRLHNAHHLPDISPQKIPGVNPATLPLVPNKIISCPPFSSEGVHNYPHSRIQHLSVTNLLQSSIHPSILTTKSIPELLSPQNSPSSSQHPPIPTEDGQIESLINKFSPSSTTAATCAASEQTHTIYTTTLPSSDPTAPTTFSLTVAHPFIQPAPPHITSKSSPLLHSPELLQIYYYVINHFAPLLYVAASLINGNSNRIVTKRTHLIQRDEVLYASEDSHYYPEAPPSSVHPWFYPPSSPTTVDHRAQQRTAVGSKTPLIRYVHVAPGGAWRRIEDGNVRDYVLDPETKDRTYLLASSKQPRTLFTDAMDMVIYLIKSGAEILIPLAAIATIEKSQEESGLHPHQIGYFSAPSKRYQTFTPIPLSIQEALPNNALTNSARLAVRLGLVRYQRWCNHTTNHLLDTFMNTLGFDRIANHAYHRYNGHHWPYAYTKQERTSPIHSPNDDNLQQPPNYGTESSKLIGNSHGLVRDIKKDQLYMNLLSLVFTTRSTQMKLGIQEVPVPVVYNPDIPQHIAASIRRFKRFQKLQQNPSTDRGSNVSIDNDNVVDDDINDVEHDDHYTANGLAKRTHLPVSAFSPSLQAIQWFYAYHYTSKHFIELAKKNTPLTTVNLDKKRPAKKEPTFGSTISSIRKEADRRLAELLRVEKLENEQNQQVVIVHTFGVATAAAGTAAGTVDGNVSSKSADKSQKPAPAPKTKAQKMSQQDLDDIMGPSKKKPQPKKNAKQQPPSPSPPPPPEPLPPVSVPETSPVQTPVEQGLVGKNCDLTTIAVAETPAQLPDSTPSTQSSKLVPNYDQDLILHPAHFPHPILFNNFYDSDDDLPLLVSLSRYHGNILNTDSPAAPSPQSTPQTLTTTHPTQPITEQCRQLALPDPAVKKAIDDQISCPHLKGNAMVARMMTESYKLAATSIDAQTQLFTNQIVLGSTGYISCESYTPEEAERLGIIPKQPHSGQAISTRTHSSNPPLIFNPTLLPPSPSSPPPQSAQTDPQKKQRKQQRRTMDMISTDHFLTRELSHALEMASTLSTLVLLYCGQNTHRGYTDLQYQVKIGQPLAPMK